MIRIALTFAALLLLSACCCNQTGCLTGACNITDPLPAVVIGSDTCTVRDSTGQVWQWRAARNPCEKAMHDCERWNLNNRGNNGWQCTIVSPAADN